MFDKKKNFSGYYRVNYDKISLKKISDYLNSENFDNIHYLNRAKLLQDISWFWYNKNIDTNFFLNFISYLRHENNVIPWLQLHDILPLTFSIDVDTFQVFR